MRSSRLADSPAPGPNTRPGQLRALLAQQEPGILLEAHDALSARLVQRSGLPAIWASSLTMSAVCGTRDANELSWTQVAESLEHMADVTTIPILADGDSGHGDFNTVRRFVRRLSARGISGVCFEDQQFPKFNSLLGDGHQLASIAEFRGKIQAAKDAQSTDDFLVVARVEALIAGLGMSEALLRATAYHDAGADAILIHSRRSDPSEVLEFSREWAGRCPLVIVPTTYSSTPIETFRGTGISALIWANHTLRAAIAGMQLLCATVARYGSPVMAEQAIASVSEIFELTDLAELVGARSHYAATALSPVHRSETLGSVSGFVSSNIVERAPSHVVAVGR
jgi:phosphoenolpyruvate phosphomutase